MRLTRAGPAEQRSGARRSPALEALAAPALVLEASAGLALIAQRWIVERTLDRLNRCRRLSKDYVATIRSAVAMLRLAMIHAMVRRLALGTAFKATSYPREVHLGRKIVASGFSRRYRQRLQLKLLSQRVSIWESFG
ncbi:MAG: transposase [Planctomycetaceae bacterium]|nr:transposase [Planctomycetaceae bacterium]